MKKKMMTTIKTTVLMIHFLDFDEVIDVEED
jgi:hypothetical protein